MVRMNKTMETAVNYGRPTPVDETTFGRVLEDTLTLRRLQEALSVGSATLTEFPDVAGNTEKTVRLELGLLTPRCQRTRLERELRKILALPHSGRFAFLAAHLNALWAAFAGKIEVSGAGWQTAMCEAAIRRLVQTYECLAPNNLGVHILSGVAA